ncbi:MAG: hypothetical protein ACRDTT_23840, partial [Pseudonocardiaceae bacterium]
MPNSRTVTAQPAPRTLRPPTTGCDSCDYQAVTPTPGTLTRGEDHYARADLASDPDWIQYFTPAKLEGDVATALYALTLQSGERDEAVFGRLWTTVD